jgi:hypothetical protein
MTIISWPYPASADTSPAGLSWQPEYPTAVVAVLVRKGGAKHLAATLDTIARARRASGLTIPHGPIAVLVMASDAAALPIVEEAALDYPFPIQIQVGSADARRAAQRAATWAESLGAPDAPVLITSVPFQAI